MKRALALLAPAVLALGLAACGGDDDDDSPDTTSATEQTTTEQTTTEETATGATAEESSSGSVADDESDMMRQVFPDLTDEQADCLVEEVGDVDPTEIASRAEEIAETCDIDASALTPDMSAISIPDLGDISIPENMDETIKQVFPGLSDEQADCLIDQLGSDFDPSKAAQVADTCNIDASDMVPG